MTAINAELYFVTMSVKNGTSKKIASLARKLLIPLLQSLSDRIWWAFLSENEQMPLTQEQLDRIIELLKDRPQCRLVYSEDEYGSGYTIETGYIGDTSAIVPRYR